MREGGLGAVPWNLVAWAVHGAIAGAFLGTRLQGKVPERTANRFFGLLFAGIGAAFLVTAVQRRLRFAYAPAGIEARACRIQRDVRSLPLLVVVIVGPVLVFQLASRLGGDDPVAVHGDDRERPLSAAVDDFQPDQIVQVLPPDASPSIDAPELVAAADAGDLGDDELVIGVQLGREARAYPIRVLSAHEIANDEIHGRPIAVTW